MVRKFRVGDKVYFYYSDGDKSGVFTVQGYGRHDNVLFTNGGWMSEDELYLVEEAMEEEWSEWEECQSVRGHSRYFRGCDWECHHNWNESVTRCRIKLLPREVKVSQLKGTVQMKPDGTPDWSTYKE